MKVIRYLAVIVLSIISGGLVNCNVSKVASIYGFVDLKMSLMAGIGATTNDITLGLMIMTFIGLISGFLVSLFLLLISETKVFTTMSFVKLISVALLVGLLHFFIIACMTYANATSGGRVVENFIEFFIKDILTDATLGFISGFLIGLASILLVKFIIVGGQKEVI
jgi:hypothetical protein